MLKVTRPGRCALLSPCPPPTTAASPPAAPSSTSSTPSPRPSAPPAPPLAPPAPPPRRRSACATSTSTARSSTTPTTRSVPTPPHHCNGPNTFLMTAKTLVCVDPSPPHPSRTHATAPLTPRRAGGAGAGGFYRQHRSAPQQPLLRPERFTTAL